MNIKMLALILALIFLVSCVPGETPEEPQVEEIEEEVSSASECDTISDPSRKIRCQAWEAEDLSMCADVPSSRFREDCVLGAAELVQDESQLEHCSISEIDDYRITCRALIKKDVNECFVMDESLAHASDLIMRDCIDLVARKLKDKSVCQAFSTHAQSLINACSGSTSDCEGRWIDGIPYNIEDCEATVEATMQNN